MTPIMQKIEDLRSAITRYNRVTAKKAKPKIGFAYGIILFADDAIEELEIYLDDLKQNKCHDALPLNFIKGLTEETYWLKEDERLYQELHEYTDRPLSAYRMTIGLDDVMYQDTLQMYRVIVEQIRRIVALLTEIEAILRAPNLTLYDYFYHHLRANYNEGEAVDCYDQWLSRSGVITLDKLMSLRAQKIAEFVNGETLTCVPEPSEDERSKVDIGKFKSQLPHTFEYADMFDDRYVIFCRTIREEGNIVVPLYDCAGLFIFQHWRELNEDQINAIFFLDKMLELINSDMQQQGRGAVLPDELATPEAEKAPAKSFDLDTPLSALFRESHHEQLGRIIESWRPYLTDTDPDKEALQLSTFHFDHSQIRPIAVYSDFADLIKQGALRSPVSVLASYMFQHSNLSRSKNALYVQLKRYKNLCK